MTKVVTKLWIVSITFIVDLKYNQFACLQQNTVNAACSSNMAALLYSTIRKLQNELKTVQ